MCIHAETFKALCHDMNFLTSSIVQKFNSSGYRECVYGIIVHRNVQKLNVCSIKMFAIV